MWHAPRFRGENFHERLSNLKFAEVSPLIVSRYTVRNFTREDTQLSSIDGVICIHVHVVANHPGMAGTVLEFGPTVCPGCIQECLNIPAYSLIAQTWVWHNRELIHVSRCLVGVVVRI